MAEAAAPAAAAPATAAASTATEGATPVAEAKPASPDADLLKQLTKASAAERKANGLVADLTKKLEAANGSMTQAQTDAAILAEVKKNPKKLLELGVSWDQVLDAISGKNDVPDDPRLTALAEENKAIKKRIDDREKAESDAKAAADKAQVEAQQAAALAKVMEIVGAEGEAPDADGIGRWEFVSTEPGLIQEAINDVVAYMDGEVEAKRARGYTQEQALGFVREHLDTYEKQQRDKKPKLVARLKAAAASGLSGKGDSEPQATQPINKPRAELPRDRFTIDAPATGEPPPAALHKEQGRPKTRARA